MNTGDADRVLITTFRADGTRTTTDEYVVALADDRIASWTLDARAWAERLADSAIVSVQAADRSGRPLANARLQEGSAELLTEGPDAERARTLTDEKYGLGAKLARAVGWARDLGSEKSPDGAVVVHIVG